MNSKRPILLVEDDEVDAMTVKRALRELKVTNRVDVAANGEEALELLRDPQHENPCIILLDLNMPGMNGFDVIEKAKDLSLLNDVKIVMCTAEAKQETKDRGKELGVLAWAIKPINYKSIAEAIKKISSGNVLLNPISLFSITRLPFSFVFLTFIFRA